MMNNLSNVDRLEHSLAQPARRWWIVCLAAFLAGLLAGDCTAQVLTPTNAFSHVYHATRIDDAAVAETRANAFTILTNGVVSHEGGIDRFDTWHSDDNGVSLDFVGLEYATPNRFDNITIELGNQFGDGGDWEAMPRVFILKDRTLVGDTVEPQFVPNWVEVFGAVETTGHVFDPIVVPGAGGTIQLDLTAASAEHRTGWGWAVGGVDGNQNASGIFHFVSFTEAFAEGEAASVPMVPSPSLIPNQPVNVVSNSYNSVGRNGDGVLNWRGQAFASVTNGLLDRDVGLGNDGFDTFSGDSDGTQTDFAGLQYSAQYTFDTISVDLGNQFGDGGDWEATPRIFILKNPVDTDQTPPEDDPTNWVEVVGATETTGHVFSPLVTPGEGGTMTFDLTSIPASQRSGWGWAVGGVDGNANDQGVINFVSVTELAATGSLVPEPGALAIALIGAGLAGVLWRSKTVS